MDALGLALFCVTGWVVAMTFHEWGQAQIMRFRGEMFAIRDSLFLEAAKGKIPFGHPGYALLRRTMNGSIRFAPNYSLLALILMKRHKVAGDVPSFQVDWSRCLESATPEQRQMLEDCHNRMMVAFLRYVATRNLLSAAIWKTLHVMEFVQNLRDRMVQRFQSVSMFEGARVALAAA